MKPREFDGLFRQKFEQGEFEYDPGNWEKLSEQLDGRSKKRSVAMWFWMPLATGIAASIAFAIGIIAPWHSETINNNGGIAKSAHTYQVAPKAAQPTSENNVAYPVTHNHTYASAKHSAKHAQKHAKAVAATETEFGIDLQNALSFTKQSQKSKFNLMAATDENKKKKTTKAIVAADEVMNTFKPEDVAKEPKVSITLLGGMNQGSQNNGYVAGANIRRMVSKNVYIESDVAYANSNNSEPNWIPGHANAAKHSSAKISNVTDSKTTPNVVAPTPIEETSNFNQSYAQVSPALGVKLMRKMSIAAGPDFQQALADNRPQVATNLTRDNVAVMPLFDVGLIGKTEYSVTKKVKAQVSYRKGINNVLTPMDKYIDRDYLQFQIKYTILNK